MSTSLKHKVVSIRKKQQCFACYRKFEIGTRMIYFVGIVDDFTYGYSCFTCNEIMCASDYDDYGFQEGFVSEQLKNEQTPEQLLEYLKLKL